MEAQKNPLDILRDMNGKNEILPWSQTEYMYL